MDTVLSFMLDFALDQQFIFLVLVFIATTLIIVSLVLLVSGGQSPVRRKLDTIRRQQLGERVKPSPRRLGSTLESLAPIVSPKLSLNDSARAQLMHAGFHDANVLTIFYALKALSLIVGVMAAAYVYFLLPDIDHGSLLIIAALAVGLYTPNVILSRLENKRQLKIRSAIPDALDLLVVCTESGLGFNSALKRVAEELELSHPEFADELDSVCAKVAAGVELEHAFEELIRRTGVDEILGLVKMLAHASRIGGSLSQTLREYTEDYRDKRNQEIEEIAAKIPTKMIFPLLLFIWPCFFIVAVGPSMISLLDMLAS